MSSVLRRPRSHAAVSRRLDQLYPWLYPPLASFPLSVYGSNVSVAAGATVTILSLPAQYSGSLTRLTAFAVSPGAAPPSNWQWTMLIAGRPAAVITMLAFQFGLIRSPGRLPGAGIILKDGEDVQLRFTNNTGAPVVNVEARLDGYQWSVSA